jgi:hypothetical protein
MVDMRMESNLVGSEVREQSHAGSSPVSTAQWRVNQIGTLERL